VEARVEALVDDLAVAVMQATGLAADSQKYEMLAETLSYPLDLADLGISAESHVFEASEPRKAY
jgi:hypothetical protein